MMIDLDVLTIIAIDGEPIHVTGGKTKEKAIEMLERTIKLVKEDKVEHEATEEE